jgi:hypothetical protein
MKVINQRAKKYIINLKIKKINLKILFKNQLSKYSKSYFFGNNKNQRKIKGDITIKNNQKQ